MHAPKTKTREEFPNWMIVVSAVGLSYTRGQWAVGQRTNQRPPHDSRDQLVGLAPGVVERSGELAAECRGERSEQRVADAVEVTILDTVGRMPPA